ncbi:DUF6691 family protein [Acerihabitans arboris]|uniref:YeeE/YedE family protein n=1 Tax=Acerihabitans arboris TaxID=2691583 RepID=A0A845SLS0_9GAMM|nr:DUF6691 family protein [Acerihabitans arboris]NDL64939.1 YeeE/YedE family protein [Acerihabitans arboris]
MTQLSGFIAGLIFGIGLLISGMSDPEKVVGFLDIAGRWDPSLALVMLGAIAAASIGFGLAKRRPLSLLGQPMLLPASRAIDPSLIAGSVVFGIGWGIAGICPGPALVLLGAGIWQGVVFIVAMLAGMYLYQLAYKPGAQPRGK